MVENFEQLFNESCDANTIEIRMRKELDNFLKTTEGWKDNPPLQVHVHMLIQDVFSEPRPLDDQIFRINISLAYLIGMLAREIAAINKNLIKLCCLLPKKT